MKQLIILIITILASKIIFSSAADPCLNFSNCTECLYNNLTCGWCGTAGKCWTGDKNGPISTYNCTNMSDANGNVSDVSAWEYTTSEILNVTTTPGSKLSPTNVWIFLRPGVPLPVNITLTVPYIPPIDFFFLLDASISMSPYIKLIRDLMPQISSSLTELVNDANNKSGGAPVTITFGMGSYIEKPCSPFAYWPEAYVLKVHTGLTTNSSLMEDALDELLDQLAINYEHPENPLEAILIASWDLGGNLTGNYTAKIGWRESAFHIVMTCTDASAHVAGDGVNMGIFKPNNMDGIPDGFPPGSEEDYPDVQSLKNLMIERDINPIFGAIRTSGVLNFYVNLSDYMGFGAWVPISNNSDEVVSAILNGTDKVLSKAILALQSDDLNRVVGIDPDGGVVEPVNPNQQIVFTVHMLASLTDTANFGNTGLSEVRYVGFGYTTQIISYTKIQCKGCTVVNPNYQVDLCGVCGGNNTACLGCNGVLYSNGAKIPTFDICGVCGGTNQSCMDCFGIPVPPGGNASVYDVCGVCGGKNLTCLGCDGIPNSGLVWNTACHLCGVSVCPSYTAAIAALAAVAVVGIVAAIVALLVLGGASAAMVAADNELIDKETSLHDNPLYEEAKKKFDNPLYAQNG